MFVGPPTITFISNHTVSLEGDKVKLLCIAINDAHANYSIQINWYKGNTLIVPNGKRILLYNETSEDSRQLKSTLILDPINPSDDGVYTCQAVNHPDLHSESQTNLTVECKMINYSTSHQQVQCHMHVAHMSHALGNAWLHM